MPDSLRPDLNPKIPEIQAYASKGWGADRIFKRLRELEGFRPGQRATVPRSFIRRIVAPFRTAMEALRSWLPSRRSDRLKTDMAVPTEFRSPLGNRYLLEFKFEARNTATGEIKTITNTIGFRRLERAGVFFDIAKARALEFAGDPNERYLPINFEVDLDSVRLTNLFRTLNN